MRFDLILISHHKNQVKPHSSPWFSAACCQIVPGNYFFRLYQQNKFSESKVKFRQASNHCKRVLEPAKIAYMLIKQKSPSLPRNLAFRTLAKLRIVFSETVNMLYLFFSTAQRQCLLHLIKQNCFLKTLLRTLILMTQVSLYMFSLLEKI